MFKKFKNQPPPLLRALIMTVYQRTRNSDIKNDNFGQKMKPTKKSRHQYSSVYSSLFAI